MEEDRKRDAEKVRELDYKQLVLSLYPDAKYEVIHVNEEMILYEVTLCTPHNEYEEYTVSYSQEYVWQRTWEKIEERMLRKFEE